MIGEMQGSLFKPGPFNNQRFVSKVKKINDADAFGVTITGLKQGNYNVLENIFYGMHNLKIPLKMRSKKNPGQILADWYTTGYLKRRHMHLMIKRDFFILEDNIDEFSKGNIGFVNLVSKFKAKECFDSSHKELIKRLRSLEPSVKNEFVNSFFAEYKPSNKEDPSGFYNPNCDGRSIEIYATWIYDELKRSSDKFKKLTE